MKITVEIQTNEDDGNPDFVFISFDREGLKFLRDCLNESRFKGPGSDVELFSCEWGGEDLNTEPYHVGKNVKRAHKLELQLRVDAD